MFGPKFVSLTFYGLDVTMYTAGIKLKLQKKKKHIFHTQYINMLLTILRINSDISSAPD